MRRYCFINLFYLFIYVLIYLFLFTIYFYLLFIFIYLFLFIYFYLFVFIYLFYLFIFIYFCLFTSWLGTVNVTLTTVSTQNTTGYSVCLSIISSISFVYTPKLDGGTNYQASNSFTNLSAGIFTLLFLIVFKQ
jgi:hypothetical protein